MASPEVSLGDFSICIKSNSNGTGNSYSEVVTGNGTGFTGTLSVQNAILNAIVTILRNRGYPDYSLEEIVIASPFLFHTPATSAITPVINPSPQHLINYLSKVSSTIEGGGTGEITETRFVRLVNYIVDETWQLFRCVAETIDSTEQSDDLCPDIGMGRLRKSSCNCVFDVDVTVY